MIGIIGGTALHQIPGAQHAKTLSLATPFGSLKSPIKIFKIHDYSAAIIARHGEQYQILPHEVNSRANIWALKSLGVKILVSVHEASALNPSIQIGDIVFAHDFVDLTYAARPSTFFGEGLSAKPIFNLLTHPVLNFAFSELSNQIYPNYFSNKLCVVTQGPRTNTLSESMIQQHLYKADIVGQTQLPEIFLAREAQMHVLCCNLVTSFEQSHHLFSANPDPEPIKQTIYGMLQKLYVILDHFFARPLPTMPESDRLTLDNTILSSVNQLTAQQKLLLSVLRQ